MSPLSCIDLCDFHALEGGIVTAFPKLHCCSEIHYIGLSFSFSFVKPTRKVVNSVYFFYNQPFPPCTDRQISARLQSPKEF